MIRRPPRSTRTDTLFPDTTLCRSVPSAANNMVRVEVVPSSMTMIFSVKALSPHPFVLTPDHVRGKHRPFLLTRCRKNGPSTSSGLTAEAAGNHLSIPCNICHLLVQRIMPNRSDRKLVVQGKRGHVRSQLGGR